MSLLHDAAARAVRLIDPEDAHRLTIDALKAGLGPRDLGPEDPALHVRMAGLHVRNCVGLAAGFDKHAEAADALLDAGFGFVEVGTVTPLPQPGNARPRVFRLERDRAVINRYGFNSEGLEAVAGRLAARRRRGCVGANLGANKDSEDRIGDYLTGLRRLWGLADYFTVNISSPNTPGLRSLQGGEELSELLGRLAELRRELSMGESAPVFLKVAPDLTEEDARRITDTVQQADLDGIIVSNTTVERPASLRSAARDETGGLSGAPLAEAALRALRWFHAAHDDKLVLIAAGGIASGADAYARIRAGACAVQLYTALVYEGPGLVRRLKRDLAARVRADGFTSVVEARGSA
jgi:dihydroorotate dehydrogenase